MSAGLAAVIGWPARHSLSPVIHDHWLAEHKIDGAFVALPVRPDDFGRVVAVMPRMGFRGASVTAPHKEAAFALSATLDDAATATGAVNLLVLDGDRVSGRNTDVAGFTASFREKFGAEALRQGPAVVIGAGGAARAIVFALAQAGAPEIRIVNRTRKRAEALAAVAPVTVFDWHDTRAFGGVTTLINASRAGMQRVTSETVQLDGLPTAAIVADIVYTPLETPLLREANARGHRTLDGLGMLMHQAVPAFAAWFGITPKVTPELRAKLEAALRG